MVLSSMITRSLTSVTRSGVTGVSLLFPRKSFHKGSIVIRVPRQTYASPLEVGTKSLILRSHQLAYSTEPSPSISEVETQSTRPSSTSPVSMEGPSKTLSNKIKKDTEKASTPVKDTSDSLQEKILPDKLYKAIELEVLSYEPAVLDSYQWFVITAATHLGITVGKCWSPLKSDKSRFPLLKSAFVHKKHQVHYEIRTYHRFLTFHKLTGSTADTFLEYIERNIPEGVGMKVTRVEVQALPEYLQKQ